MSFIMPKGLTLYSLIGNAVMLVALVATGWQLAQSKPECKAKILSGTVEANNKQAKATEKRDTALDKVTTESKAETHHQVRAAEESTHARDDAIAAVPVTGGCVMPPGLPSLDAAVDQANAAGGD